MWKPWVISWNSGKHWMQLVSTGPKKTKNLKKNGLARFERTLENILWAKDKYSNQFFTVSFDKLIENTEETVRAILAKAELQYDEVANYPSKFPNYANDNSTFGHQKTKSVKQEKVKRKIDIPADERLHIQSKILPMYEKVCETCTINWI